MGGKIYLKIFLKIFKKTNNLKKKEKNCCKKSR